MKTELIQLSKELGFKSILQTLHFNGVDIDVMENMSHYIWMCELQKWLRETHKLYITVDILGDWYYCITFLDYKRGGNTPLVKSGYSSPEKAQEAGLYYVLTLIKK